MKPARQIPERQRRDSCVRHRGQGEAGAAAGLIFAAFLGLFALDAFAEGHGFWSTALALGLHLVPAGLVLASLGIAWRWEWVGALLFLGLGTWYSFTAWPRASWILVIAGPAFLTGALFLLNWRCRKRPRAAPLPQ